MYSTASAAGEAGSATRSKLLCDWTTLLALPFVLLELDDKGGLPNDHVDDNNDDDDDHHHHHHNEGDGGSEEVENDKNVEGMRSCCCCKFARNDFRGVLASLLLPDALQLLGSCRTLHETTCSVAWACGSSSTAGSADLRLCASARSGPTESDSKRHDNRDGNDRDGDDSNGDGDKKKKRSASILAGSVSTNGNCNDAASCNRRNHDYNFKSDDDDDDDNNNNSSGSSSSGRGQQRLWRAFKAVAGEVLVVGSDDGTLRTFNLDRPMKGSHVDKVNPGSAANSKHHSRHHSNRNGSNERGEQMTQPSSSPRKDAVGPSCRSRDLQVPILAAAWSSSQSIWAVGCADGVAYLFAGTSPQPLYQVQLQGRVGFLEWNGSGTVLAAACSTEDPVVRLLDFRCGKTPTPTPTPTTSTSTTVPRIGCASLRHIKLYCLELPWLVAALGWCSDDRLVAVCEQRQRRLGTAAADCCSADATLWIATLNSSANGSGNGSGPDQGYALWRHEHGSPIVSLGFSCQEGCLATGTEDGAVWTVSAQNEEFAVKLLTKLPAPSRPVLWNPGSPGTLLTAHRAGPDARDPSCLHASMQRSVVQLLDSASGTVLWKLETQSRLASLQYNHSGSLIALTCRRASTIQIVDPSTGQTIRSICPDRALCDADEPPGKGNILQSTSTSMMTTATGGSNSSSSSSSSSRSASDPVPPRYCFVPSMGIRSGIASGSRQGEGEGEGEGQDGEELLVFEAPTTTTTPTSSSTVAKARAQARFLPVSAASKRSGDFLRFLAPTDEADDGFSGEVLSFSPSGRWLALTWCFEGRGEELLRVFDCRDARLVLEQEMKDHIRVVTWIL